MTSLIENPLSVFFDLEGRRLDDGYIYIGVENLNPKILANQINVYWDEAGTIAAAQPIRTVNGYMARNGTPARLYATTPTVAMAVYTKQRSLVIYEPSVVDRVAAALASLANTTDPTLGDAMIGVKLNATGAIARTQHDKNSVQIYAEDFGASPSASAATNTAAINLAVVYANSIGGGVVNFGAGTFTFSAAGVIETRNYGINLLSNVHLKGMGRGITILKAANTSHMDLITTPRTTTFNNVGLFDLTIDGNSANNASGGFNVWIYNGTNFYFDKIESVDSRIWHYRIEAVTGIIGGSARVNSTSSVTAGDGFHLNDCAHGIIGEIDIREVADDGLVIGAENADCHDIVIGSVLVSTPTTSGASGYGILFICDDSVVAVNKNIYNIQINSAVTYNCHGFALQIVAANMYNCSINLVDYGSLEAMNITAGGSVFAGDVYNNKFNIISHNPRSQATSMTIVSGSINRNDIDVTVYNPADNNVGVSIAGDYWSGNIRVNYDPLAAKAAPLFAVDMFAKKSDLYIQATGGLACLNMRALASNNTIKLGYLSGGASKDLLIAGTSNSNIFTGGALTSYTDSGAGNQFYGVRGCENYGVTSCSPNGAGNANIPHGLIGAPNYANISLRGNNLNSVNVQSVDATNIVVYVHTSSAAITAGSFLVDWSAKI